METEIPNQVLSQEKLRILVSNLVNTSEDLPFFFFRFIYLSRLARAELDANIIVTELNFKAEFQMNISESLEDTRDCERFQDLNCSN